jgi:DNA polymerase III alpha subunit (gram-positive type)
MDYDHIFIDTETGGLDPTEHCILSMAAIRTDSKGKVLNCWSDKIIPDRPVTDQARRVNGYDEKSWNGIPFENAIRSFNRNMVREQDEKVVFVAHFADFDRSFIRSDCIRHRCEVPLNTRAWICTGALVWPYMFNGELKSRKLSEVCKLLDIDVKACMEIYFELMRRFSTMLLLDTAATQSPGGKIYRGIRRFVNGF